MQLQQTDITRITALTNDIQKLQEFIDLLNAEKNLRIKKLYIVNEAGHQIELVGNFSLEASQKLLSLIIESRSNLMEKLNNVIKQCFELIELDQSIIKQ
jgi:hypothetical protein